MTLEKLLVLVEDFDNFGFCECSECRHDAKSHGINIGETIKNLKKYLTENYSETLDNPNLKQL